jgi:hypothetical protein
MANKKLYPLDYHEALDRCSCVTQIVDDLLLKHPAIAADKCWTDKIIKAEQLISEVYQAIGNHPFYDKL